MKKLQNVDDLIEVAYKLLTAFSEKIKEDNFDETLGGILANATEPDEKYKCDELVRIITGFERCKEKITYLHRPVKFEGTLQRKLDGKVYLNDVAVPEGTTIEYMHDGNWTIGFLKKNSKTIGLSIVDGSGNVIIETINQVTARIR